MDRYLLYSVHESGLSNVRISIEIAIGLAVATKRKLILCGTDKPNKTVMPIRGGKFRFLNNEWKNVPGIEPRQINKYPQDLFVNLLPVQSISYEEFAKEIEQIPAYKRTWAEAGVNLSHACFLDKNSPSPTEAYIDSFKQNKKILTDPDALVWEIRGVNVAYYSRFFLNPSADVIAAIKSIKPLPEVEATALKVIRELPTFNSIHVRLTDFKSYLPQDENYPEAIAASLSSWLPANLPLLICTDEQDKSFFKPLEKLYPEVIYLDLWLKENSQLLFNNLPFVEENIFGLLLQEITSYGKEFAGTPGSTFTGVIHRLWAQKKKAENPSLMVKPRFIHSGFYGSLAETDFFSKGLFIEDRDGLFSWNRISPQMYQTKLAWFMESPEGLN